MIEGICESAKKASRLFYGVNIAARDAALNSIADSLAANKGRIIAANTADLEQSAANNLSPPLLKRLNFNEAKLNETVKGIRDLIKLPDPLGKATYKMLIDDGLTLTRVTCPIGVIGVIFESRPDALVQISCLCLKSGNAAILKGGAEARRTNAVLAEIITEAAGGGIPSGWLHLLNTREDVASLLAMDKYVDLLIPRGSNEFVKYIMDNTNIPVMGHAAGICHVYADKDADIDMALKVALDSKTQYTAVCNAAETLLVHTDIAESFLPRFKQAMDAKHAVIRGCGKTRGIIACEAATEEDWGTEYLDLIISVKIVGSVDEAIGHINRHGSGHTDSIVTNSAETAEQFMALVDSAGVYHNCSTRFSDGFVYGFGAEVGISTGKLHARGPVGLEGLTSCKYRLVGDGHIIEDYKNGAKTYKHIM